MSFLKTILTYDVPSQAEVDQSFLEANGFTVYLMNAEVTRFEIGRPFDIHLQVPADQAVAADALLRQVHPERFGSAANVRKIEKSMRRSAAQLALLCAASALVAFFFWHTKKSLGAKAGFAVVMGLPVGLLLWLGYGIFGRNGKDG